jgi:hypothetical protein
MKASLLSALVLVQFAAVGCIETAPSDAVAQSAVDGFCTECGCPAGYTAPAACLADPAWNTISQAEVDSCIRDTHLTNCQYTVGACTNIYPIFKTAHCVGLESDTAR